MSDTKKRPTINDQQLSLQMQGVSDIYAKMQIELFDSMIRRLKERGNADLAENPYIWQLEKLNDMHMLNEENLKIIVERTGIAESLLREVIENEGLKVYQDTKEQLEEELHRLSSDEVRNGVTDALEAYTRQAISDLNLINSTLPASIQAVFKSVVEQTVAQVVAGTKTSDRALHDTIMSWQKKGFTGFTDSAGREWRADSYARAIIKSTTYKVYNEMRTRPAEELGIDTFYYSIKSSARAACAPLQGKIVTKGTGRTEKGMTIYSLLDYGLGTAGGCLGVHCGHYLTPFIVGVNTMPDLPDYLKDLTPEQAEENARLEAKQRATERAIRNQKERLHIAKQLGDDDLVTLERLKLRNLQGKIRNLVDSHDFLSRDYTRERLFSTPTSYNVNKAELEYKKAVLVKRRELKNGIIGVQTVDNLTIKGISEHIAERAIERGGTVQTMLDALCYPLEVTTVKYDEKGQPSKQYRGEISTVVVNPDTGNVISTNPTRRNIRKKYGVYKNETK
ncbi:putative minor capsid protein, phage associated [Streptococcus himalayensis]|uniref:Minor capsid protein, phage associated n=1 Tax=Streptococcus himalayensis TaxID=1888195 RepID=A0A917EDL8_9STRE|nr:minor capsid protein [Streptococcus phage Javan254]GGE26343.1 putative minor capsid protein, phage associated [Streptococcus himalayensis]